jgi:arsenite/tail-anchored protein-transporting ATPase
VENLRNIFKPLSEVLTTSDIENPTVNIPGLKAVINDFSANGTKLIFTMGKGGVGKTTVHHLLPLAWLKKGIESI